MGEPSNPVGIDLGLSSRLTLSNGDHVPAIASLSSGDPMPPVHRYSFRSFDRHWAIADNRVGSRMRRAIWQVHSDQQTYITTFLKEGKPIGSGPAASAAAHPRT